MLNILSNAETAAGACAGSGVNAFLPPSVAASGTGAVMFVRPRAVGAAESFSQCRSAAGQDAEPSSNGSNGNTAPAPTPVPADAPTWQPPTLPAV